MVNQKIKNVLVPLDGSKNSIRGLDKAISLARACHGTITGLYVKSVPGIYAIHSIGFMSINNVKEAKKFHTFVRHSWVNTLRFRPFDTITCVFVSIYLGRDFK